MLRHARRKRSAVAAGAWGASGEGVSIGAALAFFMGAMSSTLPGLGAGPIERLMVEDHTRLDGLLAASRNNDGSVDPAVYATFRHDLLLHIAAEEKIVSYARAKRGGEDLPVATALRSDHDEIANLLMRSPTPSLLSALHALLERHKVLEEGPRCFYSSCDDLAGGEANTLAKQLRALPEVPVSKSWHPGDRGP